MSDFTFQIDAEKKSTSQDDLILQLRSMKEELRGVRSELTTRNRTDSSVNLDIITYDPYFVGDKEMDATVQYSGFPAKGEEVNWTVTDPNGRVIRARSLGPYHRTGTQTIDLRSVRESNSSGIFKLRAQNDDVDSNTQIEVLEKKTSKKISSKK